jgi:hypothetical protein
LLPFHQLHTINRSFNVSLSTVHPSLLDNS